MKYVILSLFITFIVYNNSFTQNYFQQKLSYDIVATLDTTKKAVKGNIKIYYTNQSNDTLKYIYFLLHPNASKSRKTALSKQLIQNNKWSLFFAKPHQKGFIDSLNFVINRLSAKYKILKDSPDVAIVYLNEPLLPNKTIEIFTPFYLQIPQNNITRLGYYNNIYSITQWYPKPAVYDKEGWHPYPYLEFGEFYSEFANYRVHLKVPANITVAATGNLLTEQEKERIKKIVKYTEQQKIYSDTISGYKTLIFEQDSVHDFAWFASTNFMIAKDSIIINNNKIFCWAYFTPESYYLWKNAARYVAESVEHYSNLVGAYPYKHCTAVETPELIDGGMEYPTITNIGKYYNAEELKYVILHEVGHNWFYGILANNERKYPWIDEGINSFYDKIHSFKIIKNNKTNDWHKLSQIFDFENVPSIIATDYFYFAGSSRPIGLKSEQYSMLEYFFNTYYNASNAWFLLREYIGHKNYNTFIKNFYKNYSFKHIYPEDIEKSIFETSNLNTKWFFEDYLYSTKRSDYKIKKIIKYNENSSVVVKNKKNVYFPYTITFYQNKKKVLSNIRSGALYDTITVNFPFDMVVLNDQDMPFYFYEHNYQNNIYYNRKIFPRLKTPSLRYANFINNQKYYDILFSPAISYTKTDKLMLGILFYSPILPYSPFQLRLLPLYSIYKETINWNVYSEYNFLFNRKLKFIKFYGKFKQFLLPENIHQTYWKTIIVGIDLPFVFYKNLSKTEFTPFFQFAFSTFPFYPYKENKYITSGLDFKTRFFYYPLHLNIKNESHSDYSKITFNSRIFFPYNEKKKGIQLDFFYGTFLYNNSRIYLYNFFLSGHDAIKDYTYQETYINRFEIPTSNNLWAHQFVLSDGMFSLYTPIQSKKWMTSLRTTIAFPIPPPIHFYFVTGTYHKAGKGWIGSVKFPYEGGIEFRFIKDIFAIYFPVFMSSDLKIISDFYALNYFYKVRFMLRFNMLNPFKNAQNIHELF